MRRAAAWIIIFSLWLIPLAGLFVLIAWQKRLIAPEKNVFPEHYSIYLIPPARWWALLAVCTLLPAILAIVTRRKLAFVAGLSLVLLIASAAGWQRSHSHRDTVSYNHDAPKGIDDLSVYLVADSGGLMLNAWQPPAGEKFTGGQPPTSKRQIVTRFNDRASGEYARLTGWNHVPPGLTGRMGFDVQIRRPRFWSAANGGYFLIITTPFWFICTILSVAPVSFARRAFRHRRIAARCRAGLCIQCGYDLRASTGRCPECGAEIV